MRTKNSKLSYWAMGILLGLPFAFLLASCNKDGSLSTAQQNLAAGKSNGQTLSGDYHVVWSSIPDSNAHRINRALNNPSYSRVILDYNAAGWTSDSLLMKIPNQTLWIAGSGSNPGHLIAKTGAFKYKTCIFIRMEAGGCVVNGYSNGVDTTQGRATIEMFKSSYIPANGYDLSPDRDAIRPGVNYGAVEGVIIKNSGGDGIYIGSGHNVNVQDVIVDGANRNGITITRGTNTTITNCVFKNTSGLNTGAPTGPWCGMDVEPNAGDTLDNVVITTCVMANNAGTNLTLSDKRIVNSTLAQNVYFYGCTTAGGAAHGIEIADLRTAGPNTGQVYFQKCHVNYPALSGIFIHDWSTGKMRINFNKIFIYNAGASVNTSPPIYIDGTTSATYNVGDIHFSGSTNRIDDFNSAHPYIIGGIAAVQAFDSIMEDSGGAITIQRHYSSTNPVLSFTPAAGHTNTNITLTYIPEAWP